MVLMTFGELILVPTVSKYIADLAPADLRGRYMSFYWFAWGIARSTAPLIGGFLNDQIAPRAIWVGGLFIGLVSVVGLTIIAGHRQGPQLAQENSTVCPPDRIFYRSRSFSNLIFASGHSRSKML